MGEPFETEIKKYTETLAADPKSRVFVPLSDIYRKLGRYDEAIAIAKEGIVQHPHYMGGKMALARAYFENGDLDLAQGLLEEVLNFASDNLIANRLLSQIYLQQDRGDRAVPLLKRLRALDPNDSWVAKRLEQIQTTAVKAPPPALPVEPPPPPPALPEPEGATQTATLAALYRSQGHLDQALEIYRRLLKSDPGDEKLIQAVSGVEAELKGRQKVPAAPPLKKKEFLEKLLARITERRKKAA